MPPRVAVFLILLLAVVTPCAAQQNFKIAKIEFEGLQRFSPDEMILKTELKTGQPFDLAALDAAAQRLLDSGLFKNVAYRTKPNRDQITITFVVEEANVTTSRVVFDNFIWFSDNELIAAVQREVPSFTGMAPDNGDTVERITKSLQRFLHEKEIEATVSYMTSQDSITSVSQEHIFSVIGIPMPICTLHFPGAKNISEAKLIASSQSLIGTDYSNKFAGLHSLTNLLPLYREVGQWKAAFSPPLAKPEETATCKSGVDLTIPIDEGIVYKWNKADWSGIKALTVQELDTVLDMSPGKPANGVKIDKAEKEIPKAYGRKGYLQARMRAVPEFDDNNQTVSLKIDVREGPQFKMGRLTTKGFPDSINKSILEKWGLKAGDIYDSGYIEQFSKKEMSDILRSMFLERRAQGKPAPRLKWDSNRDPTALTVDVVIELTN
jgi:outer membrane protein insertion porin family